MNIHIYVKYNLSCVICIMDPKQQQNGPKEAFSWTMWQIGQLEYPGDMADKGSDTDLAV